MGLVPAPPKSDGGSLIVLADEFVMFAPHHASLALLCGCECDQQPEIMCSH
jgi:hypothetical protein